eukprot:m.129626 g.129626  ORF g.129626 m.129626 type:complete len:579 (+) comp14582_c0_seq2:264-2000(+)
MHGRVKVRTTEEQEEAKRKQQEAKLQGFLGVRRKLIDNKTARGVLDVKGLSLSELVLSKAPDFASIWNWRREGLCRQFETMKDAEKQKLCLQELDFLDEGLKKNPKSYSVWHQRRWVMLQAPQPPWQSELDKCTMFLKLDQRNFHCWDYRRFVVNKAPDITAEQEFEYTMNLIGDNFSNYSAWHYRSTLLPVVRPGEGQVQSITQEALDEELETVASACYIDPCDQSAWIYHRWLLGRDMNTTQLIYLHAILNEKDLTITAAFTQNVQIHGATVSVSIDGTASGPLAWVSSNKNGPSTVWTATTTLSEECTSPTGLSVKFAEGSVKSALADVNLLPNYEVKISSDSNAVEGMELFLNGVELRKALARYVLPSETLLKSQLESTRDLLEALDEGQEKKWALLAIIYILNGIDAVAHKSEILETLTELEQIDPNREGYYKDLGSRYICEDLLCKDAKAVLLSNADLHGNNIATVYHPQLLALSGRIDLSSNSLKAMLGFDVFSCVYELILDDNKLSHVYDLSALRKLKILSLKRNKLATITAVSTLSTLTLESVSLVGNPVLTIDAFDAFALALPYPIVD